VGILLAFLVTLQDGFVAGDILSSLWGGYVPWALFWGVPPVWRMWQRSPILEWQAVLGCMAGGWILAALSFALLWLSFWFYSLLGGGIYQFFKHWRSLRRVA
jgi:hypothetical protein